MLLADCAVDRLTEEIGVTSVACRLFDKPRGHGCHAAPQILHVDRVGLAKSCTAASLIALRTSRPYGAFGAPPI
ncbi:MAG: hypothetical protein JWO57_454 [Pseudonocardiales bacterium]|nr:hypothetical protein [Pseudonocardiales bacterium]